MTTKEHPILFSGPMVRAILRGDKTCTRRVVKLPRWADADEEIEEDSDGSLLAIARRTGCLAKIACPYGAPGDVLWVRETWRADDCVPEDTILRADCPDDALRETDGIIKWRPSIFMPRERSRITLRVTAVEVQRLHDITEADARAEGTAAWWDGLSYDEAKTAGNAWESVSARRGWEKTPPDYRGAFGALWCEVNDRESWDANPWVWVVRFERVGTTT